MRWIVAPLIAFAAPALAGTPAAEPLPVPAAPGQALTAWDPTAAYISPGQDEPGYRNWYIASPAHPAQVKAFNDYLTAYGVAGIVPTWQLLRTATSWERCGSQPFEVPPTLEWPHIVQTLRYVRDHVIPEIGPVEVVSGYRNPHLNVCSGGAPESAHKHYSAIDMVPLRPTTRQAMMRSLCRVQARRGLDYQVGLGFYAFLRFHVDTTKYRRWNMDPAVASICPPIVRPTDVASVGQPVAEPADPLASTNAKVVYAPAASDPATPGPAASEPSAPQQ